VRTSLIFSVVVGIVCGAISAAAQVDPGIHQAFVADNHLVFDARGRLHLAYLGWDGVQTDVFLTTSEDEGSTWSVPSNLTGSPDLGSSEPPDVAVDTAGEVVMVWSEGTGGTADVYLYSESWGGDPREIAETGNLASGPKLEVDADGMFHIVWYDEGDSHSRLAYLRYEGEGASPVSIGPETGYAQWPSLSIDADGNLYIVFSYTPELNVVPIDVFFLTSIDHGLSWSDTTRLCETALSSKFPHVVVDPYLETVHVAWQEGDSTDAEIHYASNEGKSWTTPVNLSETPGAGSLYPTLSMDNLGTLHLVWSDEEDGDYDVYHRSCDVGSPWQPAENLSRSDASSLGSTQVEYLSGYGALVCWVEGDASPFELHCNGGFSEVLFTEVAGDAHLDSTGWSRGAAWADVDGDRLEDLVVLKWPAFGARSWLHRNLGATFGAIQDLRVSGTPNGAAWGDFDNDGFRDLAVVELDGTLWLYRNAAGDSLSETASGLGMGGASGGYALAWADYDRDGWLDLYVTGGLSGPNALYHNEAGISFSDSAVSAGVDAGAANCHGVCWADYDADGWPDLYVAVYGSNLLFHNNGDGTFTETAASAGVDVPTDSEACSWADYDIDGDLDLFVLGNLSDNGLYRNDGGTFVNVSDSAIAAGQGQGSVAIWADVDNDGDPDLFTSGATTALFRNNGGGGFAEVAAAAGVARSGLFYGAGWADYDNDGDPDLFLSSGASSGADLLFLNGDYGEPVHNWLAVDLSGRASNGDGVGARVTLYAGGRVQIQEECGGLGLSQSGGTLHFGLEEAETADSLIVRWPSGTVDRTYGLSANTRTAIAEGSTIPVLWAGDTDNDGDVDPEDILPLVVHWHTEVTPRAAADPFAWEAQTLGTWHAVGADYADADGNGRVEAADLLPVGVNWSKTHALSPAAMYSFHPAIEDHGPYLDRYAALLRSVEHAPAGSGLGVLRAYLQDLVARAAGNGGEWKDLVVACAPSPSRAGTHVRFSTARAARVTLDVYDVTGRLVRVLVKEDLASGVHDVFWDGRNGVGQPVAPGVYLCRLERGEVVRVRKMVVVR